MKQNIKQKHTTTNITRTNTRHQPWRRVLAALLIQALLTVMVIAPGKRLLAEPYSQYGDGSPRDQEFKRVLERAKKQEDKTAWENYVALGLAMATRDWEDDAFAVLREEYEKINADENLEEDEKELKKAEEQARYRAAAIAWESDVQETILQERGKYLAAKAAENVVARDITEEEYQTLLAELENRLVVENELDLSGWDTAVTELHGPLKERFEENLKAQFDAIIQNYTFLTGEERIAFEDELREKKARIRRDFEQKDAAELIGTRNRLYLEHKQDTESAKLESEKESAEATGEDLINATKSELATLTDKLYQDAVTDMEELTTGPESDIDPNLWAKRMEAIIDTGLRKWELAEQDLYEKRLTWREGRQTSRSEAEKIWKTNHESLQSEMKNWLEDIQEKILAGRTEWENRIAEMKQSRQTAETELAEYVTRRREQFGASSQQLSNIVLGGGQALLEAKNAFRYYSELIVQSGYIQPGGNLDDTNQYLCHTFTGNDAALCNFYRDERTKLGASIASFTTILNNTETTLGLMMHSNQGDTGYLNDVRNYAGNLPAEIAALPAADFKTELQTLMAAKSEDFLLYKEDVTNIMGENELFVDRALELVDAPNFEYNNTANLAELAETIGKLEGSHFVHKQELARIFNKDRDDSLDDDAKLAAIKAEIETWLAPYEAATGDEEFKAVKDKRLRSQVLAYFGEGDRGYYLSGQENDPYLMTRAEYEWELLRRQRNYQARRLRRAQAVKEYADLASRYDAALEMAQVTEERTEAARAHAELNELAYLILKGDLELDPGVYNPDEAIARAKIQSEWERLLTERNIDVNALASITARLDQETSILGEMAGLANPGEVELNELLGRITVYLESNNLSEHRLTEVRRKLEEYRRQVVAGLDAGALADKWSTLTGLAGALLGQVNGLKEDYNLDDLNALVLKIKGDGASDRGLIGQRSMPQINTSMDEVKEQIKANAELLKAAQEKLDEAQKEYHNAFVDLHVLTSSDASELIQIELAEATGVLASTLNRMQKIETIPGFEDKILDQAEAARLSYLNEVSQGEAAGQEFLEAGVYLSEVQALEESKKRKLALETALAGAGFDINNIVESAATLITKESELVNRDAENVSLRSAALSRAAFDRLNAAKQAYDQTLTRLANLTDPLEISEARANLSNLKENLARNIELLAGALRGEYTARQKRVSLFLETPADLEALETNLKNESETLEENAYTFAGDAAAKLENFLTAHNGKTYLELLDKINTEIQTLQENRNLKMSSAGYGAGTADSVNTYNELRVARNLLMSMKAGIEHSNSEPDEFDGRDKDKRWSDLLKEIRNIATDAEYHKEFAAAIPDDKNDPWVTDYRNERSALLARLDTVITQADVYTAYQNMSAADRETLALYGSIDTKLVKNSLENIRRAISVDIKSLEFSYEEIYLREMALKESKKAALIEPELERLSRDVQAKYYELGELGRNKRELETAGGDVDRIVLIQARIDELTVELTPLEASLELKETEYRQAVNALKEAQSPGSTSQLFQAALGEFYDDTQGIKIAAASYQELAGHRIQKETENNESTAGELVKGILGFYKTDSKGELLRDSAGKPIATDEYLTILNGQATDINISEVLSGDLKGPDLEVWVGRLQDYLRDKERAAQTPAEVRAAVELLEESLLEYRAAIAMIENGDSHDRESGAVLKAAAQHRLEKAEALAEKLALVANMEAGLNQIITETAQARERALQQAQAAEAQGQSYTGAIPDITDAALAFLGRPENVKLFQLFKGYDAEGNVDGVVDVRLQERLDEIRLLADRLRENRYEAAIGGAQKQYAEFQRKNLAILTGLETGENTVALWPDVHNFLENYTALSGQELIYELDALPEAGFRAAIFSLLENTNSEKTIYLDQISAILARELTDGSELKTKIKDRLVATQETLKNELTTFGLTMDAYVERSRDLESEKDVAELLNEYAGRGEVARTKLLPEFANLDAGATVAETKTWLTDLADTHFSEGVYISIRSEIYRIAERLNTIYEASPQAEADRIKFLADMQTQVAAYLNNIAAPADLTQIEEELQTARLREALAIAGLSEEYNEENFAPELREFVLIYQYNQAETRYADYLKDRDSVLDLRGINGEFANRILVKDFEEYMAANSVADFIANADSPRYLSDYIQAYFTARNTTSELLPAGGLEILERTARLEFQRMTDPVHIDENSVFADFKEYIYLSRGQDFVVRNGISLSGADEAEKRANFNVDFAGFWSDATYTVDGKTMGERYPGVEQREDIANLIFSELLYPTALTDYLPGVLSQIATEGRLSETLKAADAYLPDELTAIADYQNKDYRTLAAGVSEYTAAELARLEVDQRLAYEELTLSMSDAELAAIIDRAGQSDAPPEVQAELLSMMKHLAESRATEGVSSAAAAINVIRQNRVIFEQYTNENEREAVADFMAARRGMVQVIEAKFFAELSSQNDELREKAKLDRGLFFASLVRKNGGVSDAFYNGLTSELQGEFDKLTQTVFVDGTHKLDADEIADLNTNLADYQKLFDLRSGQELVVSGIFEAAETRVLNGLLRSADQAMIDLVRENRNATTISFLNLVYYGAANADDLSDYADTSGIAGLKAELVKIYESLDPEFKKTLAKEEAMLTRLTSKYLEEDSERNRLKTLFNDPALFSKEAAWQPDYELDKSLSILGADGLELESALFGLVQDHGIFFEKEYREMERERYVATKLRDFARERGEDLRTSTFANYRTYMGAERVEQIKQYRSYIVGLITAAAGDTTRTDALKTYQAAVNASGEPEDWIGALTTTNGTPGNAVKSFGEFFNGQVLSSESLEITDTKDLLLNQDWQNILTTDNLIDTKDIKVGDDTVQVRSIKTVLAADAMNTVGGDFVAHMEKIHYANLANNYLDSITNLHRGLMDVFRAAEIAETRKTKTDTEIKQKFVDGYDSTLADIQNLDVLREIQNAASARKDAHGATERQNAYNVVSGVEKQRREAADKFAQAGRRGLIVNNGIEDLINTRFNGADGVKTRFENARNEVEELSNEAEALRDEYGGFNTEYVNRLNETAGQFRAYTQTIEEYERLQAVQDYAETPYLHAGADDENDYSGDAQAEYNLALAAYNQAQEAMKNAAVDMQGQGEKLARFNQIVTVLEGTDEGAKASLRVPLTDEERKELAEFLEKEKENETLTPEETEKLTGFLERHTYELYGDMIIERAAYIKHSMRMVRVHKANEIVNAEIERRRAVVAEKEQQFKNELNRRFPMSPPAGREADAEKARMAVYQRLSSINETSGGFGLLNEYRAWYWGAGQWANDVEAGLANSTSLSALKAPQFTPTQILEAAGAAWLVGATPGQDRDAIATYLGLGGQVPEFQAFGSVYYGALMAMGFMDMAILTSQITTASMQIAIGASMGMIAQGNTMILSGLLIPGAQMVSVGTAGIYTATLTMAAAQAAVVGATVLAWTGVAASAYVASDANYITSVQQKEREYQEALGALEYFTKVPDVETLKTRVIEWGARHGDTEAGSGEKLYKITEEDLKYIYDTGENGAANYREFTDENGDTRKLTADEKTDALDVSLKKRETKFKSAAGDEYDPSSIKYINPGPPLGGYYYIDGEKHVEIRALQHDGSYASGYAKVIADSERKTYDIGEVLSLTVTHGENLRQEAKARYYGAGNAVDEDQFFLLGERDNVNEKIFDQASARTEGGKEFTGYRMAFTEYQQNVNAVVEAELSQKIAIQRQEWDLREQELADKYDAWSRKMATILKRGKQSWEQAIDNYRDNWITWEKEQDAQEAGIEKQWDEKIKEHFKRKAEWEQTMKTKFQETTVRGSLDGLIDDLNNQIISFSANTGINMDELNKLAEINKALDEIKTQLPTEAEQLNALNKNIKNFKTTLAISEISSSDFLGQIQGDTRAFSAQMKEHSDEMRTVANVKAMEQYKKMLDQFKFQLDDRNAKVAKQTRNAAMAQGYVQVGDKFVKKGVTAGVYGVVNAYEYFDTENEFIKALSETGVDSVNGEGLVTFLKEKSQIEVTAYFHTQKLAIQSTMNKLMGTGDASMRESSRDEKDIGRIGVWIGGQGNSELANRTLTEMNKKGMYSRDAYMRDLLANNAMFGGFGQLGSATWRPGEKQILGGFYTQLSWMGGEMGKRDAAHSQGRYTPGPAAAMLNQFNVGLMAANSYKNVELAAATNGTSRGYMWEAQMLGFAKQGAGALAAAASASIPILGPIIGVAIKAAADSIKVNTQTGDRTFKLDEKDKVALGVSLTMALVTLGVSSVADTTADTIESAEALLEVSKDSDIINNTKSIISIAQNTSNSLKTIQKGVQLTEQLLNTSIAGLQTDNRGRITGWKADNNFWQSAAGNAIGLGLDESGLFNLPEKSLIGGVSNKAISIGSAYYSGDQNAIASLVNPDLSSAGGLLSMATSGHFALLSQREQVANIRKSIREGYGEDIYAMMAKEGGLPRPLDPLNEKHLADIFAGAAGIARRRLLAEYEGVPVSTVKMETTKFREIWNKQNPKNKIGWEEARQKIRNLFNDNAWNNADGMSQAMIDRLYESNKGSIDLNAVDNQWLGQALNQRYSEYNDFTSTYSIAEQLSELEVQARLNDDVKSGKYEINSSEYNKHEEEYREEFQSKSALKDKTELLLYQKSQRIDPSSLTKGQITTINYRGQSFTGLITLKTDDLVIIKTKQGTEVTVSLDSLMKDGNTITPLSRLGDAYRRDLIENKSLRFMANFHKERDISNTDDGAWLREQNNIAYSQSQAGLLSQYYQIFNDANSKLSEGDDSWAKAFGILDNVGFGIIGSVSSYFYKNNAVQGLNSYQEQVYRNRFDGRVAHYSDKYSTALMAIDLAQTLLTGGAGVLAKLGGAALKLGSMVAKTSGGLIAKYGVGLGSSMMALPFLLKKSGKFGKLRKQYRKLQNEGYSKSEINLKMRQGFSGRLANFRTKIKDPFRFNKTFDNAWNAGLDDFAQRKLDAHKNNYLTKYIKSEKFWRNRGKLKKIAPDTYESLATGLKYGPDPSPHFNNRIQHILKHSKDDPLRMNRAGYIEHGVFYNQADIFKIIDEAYLKILNKHSSVIRSTQTGNTEVFEIFFDKPIGYIGGYLGHLNNNPHSSILKLVIKNRNEIITAYPMR